MNQYELKVGNVELVVKTEENEEYIKNIEQILSHEYESLGKYSKKFNDAQKQMLVSFMQADKNLKSKNELENEKNMFREQIQESKDRIIALYKENEELRNRESAITQERDKIYQKLEGFDGEKKSLVDNARYLEKTLHDKEQKLIQVEGEIDMLKVQLANINEKCQELTGDREQFLKDSTEANNQKNELNSRISKLISQINEKDKIISENEKTLKDFEELRRTNSELNRRCELLNKDKEKYLEELLDANGQIENLNFTITELKENLNNKETENFQNSIYIDKLKRENDNLMNILDEKTTGSSSC